jgi:hypothetical protein
MHAKAETTHNRDIALIVLVQEFLNPMAVNNLLKVGNLTAVNLKVVNKNLLVEMDNHIMLQHKAMAALRSSSVLR